MHGINRMIHFKRIIKKGGKREIEKTGLQLETDKSLNQFRWFSVIGKPDLFLGAGNCHGKKIGLGKKQLTEHFFVCGFFYFPLIGDDVCAEARKADVGIFHAFSSVHGHEPDTGDRLVIGLRAGHRKNLKAVALKTVSHRVNKLVGSDHDGNVGGKN